MEAKEHPKLEKRDLDFINDWIDVSVENEIWRGIKLREEKPVADKTNQDYSVVNIDFKGSILNECQGRGRKRRRKSHKGKAYPSTSPFLRPNTNYYPNSRLIRKNSPKMKSKHYRKCSMRIAELAVPTKRQCIDTWRNKSYILPEFMVDRLKQHVMDQRPIVKIPEAIICFQQKRRPQSAKKNSQSKNDNTMNHEVLNPLHKMDTRTLSILFGHKIAKTLAKPLNLTLNSDLQKLSRVVASDISQLMKSYNSNRCVGNQKNKAIHTDVSNKITVWIASILQDLSYKLLEEDLRVKKEKEDEAETTEVIVTIMEKILRQERKFKSADLEEEEGPVLDFIDDLVDNVVSICEPVPVVEEESDTSESAEDEIMEEECEKSLTATDSTENKTGTLITDAIHVITEEIKDLTDADEILTDNEYFKKEIYNIIHSIDRESEEEIIEESENTTNIEVENNIDKTPENNIDPEIGSIIEQETGNNTKHDYEGAVENDNIQSSDRNSETEYFMNVKGTHLIDVTLKNIKQYDEDKEEDTNNAENHDSNVSEVFAIDSGDDQDSKIVKVSVTDLVNPENHDELAKTRVTEGLKNNEPDQTIRNIHNNASKPNIYFAEPNEHLLSDADESWPADLTDKYISKHGDTSKSITSLGYIDETDEKQLTPTRNKANETDNEKTIDINIDKAINDKLSHKPSNDKYNTTSQTSLVLPTPSEVITTTSASTSVTVINLKTPEQKLTDNSLTVTKADDDNCIDKPTKQEEHKPAIKDSLIKIESTTILDSTTVDKKIPSRKASTQSQIDYGWKVHPTSAPSWVTWGHGRGEPSEDSIPVPMKPIAVRESEMRKWCKDLEKAFVNLEMWSDWIDNTCKEAMYLLKRKETTCSVLCRKGELDWIRLRKNINRDAILWTKLYHRTENNFKNLKRKYNNVQVVSAEYCALCICNKTNPRKCMNTNYHNH